MLIFLFCFFNNVYALDTKSLYTKTVPSVVSLITDTPNGKMIGTGFYALASDIIVTCYHVIKSATSVTAKNESGNYIKINGVIDYSESLDIALLKCDIKNKNFLDLDANMPMPGTTAYALGSPEGLEFSFSNGIVSQIRELNGIILIQFTCPVSQGNSGGPLISDEGKVLGVVVSQLTEGQNLNFSIPAAMLYTLNRNKAITVFKKQNVSNSQNINVNNSSVSSNEHFQYGEKYLKAQLYDEALSEFAEVLKIYPENLEIYNKICFCLYNTNQISYLKEVANEATRISIKNKDKNLLGNFYFFLGEGYYSCGEIEKAIQFYKLALDEKKTIEQYFIYCCIGDCYHYYISRKNFRNNNTKYREDYKNAIIYYEEAIKLHSQYLDNIDFLFSLANCYSIIKDLNKSIIYYEKILKLEPKNINALIFCANSYHNIKNYNQAILYYDKAFKNCSDNNLLEFIEESLNDLASELVLDFDINKDLDKIRIAIAYYEKVLKINPKNIISNEGLGNCYFRLEDYKTAITYYQKALKIDSNNSSVINSLGDCYFSLEDYKTAITYYQKALKIDPNNSFVIHSLGYCYFELKDYKTALI